MRRLGLTGGQVDLDRGSTLRGPVCLAELEALMRGDGVLLPVTVGYESLG